MSPRAACRLETLGFTAVYDYTGGKADWLAAGTPSEGAGANTPHPGILARTDIRTCGVTDTVAAARARVTSSGEERCVVVSDTDIVVGVLDAKALEGDGERIAGDAMRDGPATVRANEDLTSLLARMRGRDVTSILVTDPEGRLIGRLHLQDGDAALLPSVRCHPERALELRWE